jgi:hypothetical protein
MTDRDPHDPHDPHRDPHGDPYGDCNDSPRQLHGPRSDPREPAQVANDAAADSWRRGGEPRYAAAAPPRDQRFTRAETADTSLDVRIEFVQLDGPPGRALRRRQAQIMRKVLQWIAEHPKPDDR